MKYTEIFDYKAEVYKKFRPQYAQGFINKMIDESILSENKICADVGCGTGMLSEQILKYVKFIYGIEPNMDMLEVAKRTFRGRNNYMLVNGTAEYTTLNEHSIDIIGVGQAFHWFDQKKFKREALRILKNDGVVFLVWNKKEECEQEYDRKIIVNKYRMVKDTYDCDWNKRILGIADFFDGEYKSQKFENNLSNTYEEFIGRTLSASHAITKQDKRFKQYIDEWTNFFEKYEHNGRIMIPNSTVAFWGKLNV